MAWVRSVRVGPTRIGSVIGTDEGYQFLARMMAEVAYRAPKLLLWVKTRAEDTGWDSLCEWEARQLLNRLGERDRAKAIETKAQLKLVKGAGA